VGTVLVIRVVRLPGPVARLLRLFARPARAR